LIGLLIALYPAHWRRRYGEEFRAVLETRPLGPFDVADVLLGALDARLSRRRRNVLVKPNGGHRVMLRIGGFGAISGGTLWFTGIAGLSADMQPTVLWSLIAIAGNLAILVALVGLSAFQAHLHPRLAWVAFAIPAFGTVASIAGLFGLMVPPDFRPVPSPLDPWSTWLIGLLAILIGSALFAVATVRAQVLWSRAAVALGVSAGVAMVIGFGSFGQDVPMPAGRVVMASVFFAFSASWVALGVSALRRGPIRAITPI